MNPKIADIQEAVCSLYGITLQEMLSDRRNRHAAWPRQVAIFLAFDGTASTKTEIGKQFGRDHSTVLFAIRAVKRRMDGELALNLDVLRKHLGIPTSGIPKATPEHFGKPHVVPKATPQHFGAKKKKQVRPYRASPHSARNRGGKARSCMTCGKGFMSEGPHNRMCEPCRGRDYDVMGVAA